MFMVFTFVAARGRYHLCDIDERCRCVINRPIWSFVRSVICVMTRRLHYRVTHTQHAHRPTVQATTNLTYLTLALTLHTNTAPLTNTALDARQSSAPGCATSRLRTALTLHHWQKQWWGAGVVVCLDSGARCRQLHINSMTYTLFFIPDYQFQKEFICFPR